MYEANASVVKPPEDDPPKPSDAGNRGAKDDPPKPPDKLVIDGKEMGEAEIRQLLTVAESNPALNQEVGKLRGQLEAIAGDAQLAKQAREAGIDLKVLLGGGKKDEKLIPDIITVDGDDVDINPAFIPTLTQVIQQLSDKITKLENTTNAGAYGALNAQNTASRLAFQQDNGLNKEQMAALEQYAVDNKILTQIGEGENALTVIDYKKLGEAKDRMGYAGITSAIEKGDPEAMVAALNSGLPGLKDAGLEISVTKTAPRVPGGGGTTPDATIDKWVKYADGEVDIDKFTSEEVDDLIAKGVAANSFREAWEMETKKT